MVVNLLAKPGNLYYLYSIKDNNISQTNKPLSDGKENQIPQDSDEVRMANP